MPDVPTIVIRDTPLRSSAIHAVLKPGDYLNLHHSKRFQGGDWDLSLYIPPTAVSIDLLAEWFNEVLMYRVTERAGGGAAWKGFIWEIDLVKAGTRRRRSMSTVWNACKTIYTQDNDSLQAETSYFVDADSVARYGRREFIEYLDNVTQEEAEAKAQDTLAKTAWPWAKTVAIDDQSQDGLYIMAVGDIFTLNNLYCTVTTEGYSNVDAFITSIVTTDSQFLNAGSIAANSLSVQREQRRPTRAWDLILRLVEMGDGSGAAFRVSVTDGLLNYEAFDPTPIYEWRTRARGLEAVGGRSLTWEAGPGVVRDYTIPAAAAPDGSFLLNMRDTLIDEVQMWQGSERISTLIDDIGEEALIAAKENYERMMTDYTYDPVHTAKRRGDVYV